MKQGAPHHKAIIMTNKFNFIEQVRVDSIKIRIPLTHLTIHDYDSFQRIGFHTERTYEVDEFSYRHKAQKFKTECGTITLSISKVKITQELVTDCLIILVNSKQLKHDYFQGITIDTIQRIYEAINSIKSEVGNKVLSIDYETFIYADTTDIDYKIDFRMNQTEWTNVIKDFMTLTYPTKTGIGYEREKYKPKKSNDYLQNGLQYNTRKSATTYKPFFKLYYKGGEFLTPVDKDGSKDFYDSFLKDHFNDSEIRSICRLETTIKDKKMAEKYGIKSTQLLKIISLPTETMLEVFRKMFESYMQKRKSNISVQAPTTIIAPTSIVFYNSIMLIMKSTGMTGLEAIDNLIQNIPGKVSRSRTKTQLVRIYNDFIQGGDVDLSNKKVNDFFKLFDWNQQV